MTAVLPVGYVTILEAAEMLQPAMYAGVPDLPIVIKLRQEGIEVNDGPAINRELATWFGPLLHGATLAFRGDGCPERTDHGNRARADRCSPGASTRTTSQIKAIATNYESALMPSEGPCTSS